MLYFFYWPFPSDLMAVNGLTVRVPSVAAVTQYSYGLRRRLGMGAGYGGGGWGGGGEGGEKGGRGWGSVGA